MIILLPDSRPAVAFEIVSSAFCPADAWPRLLHLLVFTLDLYVASIESTVQLIQSLLLLKLPHSFTSFAYISCLCFFLTISFLFLYFFVGNPAFGQPFSPSFSSYGRVVSWAVPFKPFLPCLRHLFELSSPLHHSCLESPLPPPSSGLTAA